MSFDGQVLWKRRLVVVWATATIGAAAMAPAAVAAPFRNLRRGAAGVFSVMDVSWKWVTLRGSPRCSAGTKAWQDVAGRGPRRK